MIATNSGFELASLTYDEEAGTYRFEYDRDTTPASLAVVTALSEVMDVDPIELEPLHDSVDTDALDALASVRGTANGDVHVTWTHEEYAITVHSYGVIAVARPGDERPEGRTGEVRER